MFKKGLFTLLMLLLVFFSINMVFPVTDFFGGLSLLNDVHSLITDKYVDEAVLDDQELSYAAIKGMLSGLDRHTAFFTPEESRDFLTDIEGSFGGLGIRIDKKGEYIIVVSPIEGTPAYRMGLKPGDRIVEVDGKSAVGMTLDAVMDLLRGDVGTKVVVGISRDGFSEILPFEIIRDKIEMPSITSSFIIGDSVGYVRFTHFQENSFEEMVRVLGELDAAGMKSLILDLRYNPGGVLTVAHKILDLFIGDGEVLVSTKGRGGKLVDKFVSTAQTPYRDLPLVLLVDGGSASASEIMAGAIKDLKRGYLVGEKTYGKGSVQRIFSLGDGSALKVTVAHYYTPSGICVDGTGIEPDYPIKSVFYSAQLADLVRLGEFSGFVSARSGEFSVKGGHVTPDPFEAFVKYLEAEGYDFEKSFFKDELTGEILKSEVPRWRELLLEKLRPDITKRIEYEILTSTAGEEAARKYWIKDDPMVLKSLELLKQGK